MSNQDRQNQKTENTKHLRKKPWLAAIISVIAVICCLLLWDILKSKSINEQLAAIDAARAIPASENAATIYNQVFTEYGVPDMLPRLADPKRKISALPIFQPWQSNDYPELAKWIEQQQEPIGKLLEASRLDKCWFPITDNTVANLPVAGIAIIRRRAAPRWAYLLARAANNDIAEGRIQSAIEKHRCIMQLGRHFCQQPVTFDVSVGMYLKPLTK